MVGATVVTQLDATNATRAHGAGINTIAIADYVRDADADTMYPLEVCLLVVSDQPSF